MTLLPSPAAGECRLARRLELWCAAQASLFSPTLCECGYCGLADRYGWRGQRRVPFSLKMGGPRPAKGASRAGSGSSRGFVGGTIESAQKYVVGFPHTIEVEPRSELIKPATSKKLVLLKCRSQFLGPLGSSRRVGGQYWSLLLRQQGG
jgi:hypothetical protein